MLNFKSDSFKDNYHLSAVYCVSDFAYMNSFDLSNLTNYSVITSTLQMRKVKPSKVY